MIVREKLELLLVKLGKKFTSHFGFCMKDLTFDRVVDYFYSPRDSSSLAVTRILFGLAMLFDIPDERGGAVMEQRWRDPKTCHFPLLPTLQGVMLPYMAVVYATLWLGALGIMLGYKYRLSATMFAVCYWYLFLIEKSFWNNHSYLFGLVSLLLIGVEANCYWSLDVYLGNRKRSTTVPYWNYFVLKYQFFILYFVAGLKKGTAEWLTGYSVLNLSEHWVFSPFKLFLTVPQIDYLIVHWFAFVFDLTIAFWMMWSRTRHVAMVFCAAFHLMNSRLFKIGMFPWVCLATMPLFYPFNWPKLINIRIRKLIKKNTKPVALNTKDACDSQNNAKDQADEDISETKSVSNNEDVNDKETSTITIEKGILKRKITVSFIILYAALQAFLPYSHFLTKGYNNWTNGLYGYSWDMMVHSWDTNSVIVKIVTNANHEEFFINPHTFTLNDRWSRHGDMVHQYAKCLERNIHEELDKTGAEDSLKNISIYLDVWCSLNGRFRQRMFDPKVDLLQAPWNPFSDVAWLMPLLVEATDMRSLLDDIRSDVHKWSNYSDVIFVADFPGYDLENYMQPEMTNVTLTVLGGKVAYETEVRDVIEGHTYVLETGENIPIRSGTFHKVINIGREPAYYMYTFVNKTEMELSSVLKENKQKQMLPLAKEFLTRLANMGTFFQLVLTSLFQLLFRLPMWLMIK